MHLTDQELGLLYEQTRDMLELNKDTLKKGPDEAAMTKDEWLSAVTMHNKTIATLQNIQKHAPVDQRPTDELAISAYTIHHYYVEQG